MRSITRCEDIPEDKAVYIYGAGTAGRTVFTRIPTAKRDSIKGFIDSYARGEIEGLPILDPMNEKERLKDAAILIASQAWVEIQHKLLKLGLTNLYNAYPLYTASVSSPPVIENAFHAPALRDDLIEWISKHSECNRFVVVGKNGSAKEVVEALKNSLVSDRIVGHCNIGPTDRDDFNFSMRDISIRHSANPFDKLIIAVPSSDLRLTFRLLRTIQKVHAPSWVPKSYLDNLLIPHGTGTPLGSHLVEIRDELTERHGDPLIVMVPPCAGTMRFEPQIKHLLSLLNWTEKRYMPITTNTFFFSRFRDKEGKKVFADTGLISEPYAYESTEAYYWYSKSLNHYEYISIHDHRLDMKRFSDLNMRIVVLMRDPRDIINSYFHRVYTAIKTPKSSEDFLLEFLDGRDEFWDPEMGFRWASAREWTDSYLAAMESPNMEIVRFEDLHRDEIRTMRDLLSRLELYPNPFIDITEDTLRVAAHLGSFEHQTGGQAKRGEGRLETVGQTSCRKGVVGDWRSTFTPAVVEKFKRLTGDALIRLGYEDSMDWGLDTPQPG